MSKPQTHKYSPKQPEVTIEWPESGRWVRSCNRFANEELAAEHAQFIGCHKFRIVPAEKTSPPRRFVVKDPSKKVRRPSDAKGRWLEDGK